MVYRSCTDPLQLRLRAATSSAAPVSVPGASGKSPAKGDLTPHGGRQRGSLIARLPKAGTLRGVITGTSSRRWSDDMALAS